MLNPQKIEQLKPRAMRYTVTDGRGLGLEVMPSGLKVWRYRLGSQRLTIGRYPRVDLKKARAWRDKWDPIFREHGFSRALYAESQTKTQPTVREFSDRYIAEVLEKRRKDPKQMISILRNQVWPKLGRRVMSKVTGAEVREIVFQKRDAGRAAAAAKLRDLIKRLWDYAIVCGVATINPAHATPLKFIQQSRSRSRTLSRREIAKFVEKLLSTSRISHQHKHALMLLLLTMARKSELLLARWQDVNLGTGIWEIPAEHSKTGTPHIVYLSMQALRFMRQEGGRASHLNPAKWDGTSPRRTVEDFLTSESFVFPTQGSFTQPMHPNTLNKALARVDWGMPHFTIHDLRRTAATLLSEEGFPPDVIEKALNHSIKGIRGVYNRAEYAEQRKEMLQRWADLIDNWRAEFVR